MILVKFSAWKVLQNKKTYFYALLSVLCYFNRFLLEFCHNFLVGLHGIFFHFFTLRQKLCTDF